LNTGLEIARRLPPPGCSEAQALEYVRWLTGYHYENFHVVTRLLPSHLRPHFASVYAYCRWADDLGDETGDPARSLILLGAWQDELDRCYAGSATHPVFIALAPAIRQFDIPIDPFRDLLTAFRQDQHTDRHPTWDSVITYCRYSANPVGRLVLYLCGYRDPERQHLSDATCTALQLANFWQDVASDLDKGRIYIPLDVAAAHGVSEAGIETRQFDGDYAALMRDLIARTRALFAQGAQLHPMLPPALRVNIQLFHAGGLAVLDGIERINYDTLHLRPALPNSRKARLLARAFVGKLLASFSRDSSTHADKSSLAGHHA
jgi:squalene synthase HpnC